MSGAPAPARSGPILLAVAAGLLVVADVVGWLTARQVAGSRGCPGTTHTSAVAPVLLAAGGFLAVLSLAARVATVRLGPRSPRPRRGLFLTVWIFLLLAFTTSGLVMYVTSNFRLCS